MACLTRAGDRVMYAKTMSVQPAIAPLQIQSVVDQVYAAVRARILSGELARGSRLLETARGAEHVYLMRLGDGWPHLHYHLVPRYPGTPKDYRGLEVRDWPGVPRCGWEEIAAIAAQLRQAAAAR